MREIVQVPPFASFSTREGSRFPAPDLGTFLELDSAKRISSHPEKYEAFSLIFSAPAGIGLPSDTYRLDHPVSGPFDMYMERIGSSSDALHKERFQAIMIRPSSALQPETMSSESVVRNSRRRLTPFVGELRIFGGNYAIDGWALCQGQLLPIAQNQALFSLLGTMYGGDGQTVFALPDLRGRVPIGAGSTFQVGEMGGGETVTLVSTQLPSHQHTSTISVSSSQGNALTPAGNVLSGQPDSQGTTPQYSNGVSNGAIAATGAAVGGGLSHPNVQPFMAMNFIISLFGIYPSPN